MAKVSEIQNGDIKKNVIVLKSVYGKVGQVCYIQPTRDRNGRLPASVRRVDSKGDMILTEADKKISMDCLIPENRVFEIDPSDPAKSTFDLNDPVKAAEWEAIKGCFLIAPSRDAKDDNGNYLIHGTPDSNRKEPRYGLAELYIEIPGKESARSVDKKKMIHKAQSLILEDQRGYDGQLLIARVLGRNMSNMPAADVELYLLSFAEKNPEKIIELYTGGDLQLKLLLITAKEKGIIVKNHGLYEFGEDDNTVPLGYTDNNIIDWMKQPKNQATMELIRRATYPEVYAE